MKLTKKLLGITAIIAVIGFLALPLTGCPDVGDDGDSTTASQPSDKTPTVDDYDIDDLSWAVENGEIIITVSITAKLGKSGGTFTVWYEGIEADGTTYEKSTTAPTKPGTYTVTFDVAAAQDWNAVTGLSAGTLVIDPTPSLQDYVIGKMLFQYDGEAKAVTVTPKSGKSTGAITVWYEGTEGTTYGPSTDAPIELGDYAVTFDVAASGVWLAAEGIIVRTSGENYMRIVEEILVPKQADYEVTGERTVTYNGSTHSLTVALKADVQASGGDITVYYKATSGTTYESATPPTNAGTYTVTFDVAEWEDYEAETGFDAGTLTIEKATPALSDFDITGATVTYNATPRSLSVVKKTSGARPDGTVTLYYVGTAKNGVAYAKSTTPPTNAGDYTVTFDVAGTANWNAESDLSAGALEIQKATPVLADYDIANDKLLQVANNNANPIADPLTVTVKTSGVRSDGAVTVYYEGTSGTTYARSTSKPGIRGTFAVTFNVAETANWKPASLSTERTLTLNIFSSIYSLGAALSMAGANTAATAYPAELNVSTLGGMAHQNGSAGYTLNQNSTKYVSLDLSGSNLASIGDSAFQNCASLASITIPASVNSIDNFGAFQNCTSLASVTFPANANITSIGQQAFNGCSSLASINIPDSVTSIGQSAFDYCASLASVTFPTNANFTSIGNTAFRGCTSLASVTIPASVNSIGNSAFANCTNLNITWYYNPAITATHDNVKQYLKTLIIPDGVTTSIGASAFSQCFNLTSVTIGNGVTSIGSGAFDNCANLTSITFVGTIPSSGFVDTYPYSLPSYIIQSLYLTEGAGTYVYDADNYTWTKQ